MKKITLFVLLWVPWVQAQVDPDLFDQDWYLYDVIDTDFNEYILQVAGYQVFGESYDIDPFVRIQPSLDFNGLGICDTFEGTLSQDGSTNNFLAEEANVTDVSCEIPSMDEPFAIGPFGYVPDEPDFFTIVGVQVQDDADGFQTMGFITQPFIVYRYRNTPVLANSDYRKTLFKLYPNPASDELQLVSDQNNFILATRIFSNTGQELVTHTDNQGIQSISVANFPAGVYFVEIQTISGKEIHRFVKE